VSKVATLFAKSLPRRQRAKLLAKMAKSKDGRPALMCSLLDMRKSLLVHQANGGSPDDADAVRVRDWIASIEVALGITSQVEL
jgi:hypothetical protein